MGSHYEGSPDEIRSLNAYIAVTRAADSMNARLYRRLIPHNISLSQFAALDILLHLGPLSPHEIAHKMLKSGGNITMVVDNLEKRGFIRRERQLRDRRVVQIFLTDQGRALIKRLMPEAVDVIGQEMSVLSESDKESLRDLCRRVGLKDAPVAV
jgi:MarR family 2-MHQ and catechol resistance regulon transcriptional repressor